MWPRAVPHLLFLESHARYSTRRSCVDGMFTPHMIVCDVTTNTVHDLQGVLLQMCRGWRQRRCDPAERTVVSASDARTIKVWDLAGVFTLSPIMEEEHAGSLSSHSTGHRAVRRDALPRDRVVSGSRAKRSGVDSAGGHCPIDESDTGWVNRVGAARRPTVSDRGTHVRVGLTRWARLQGPPRPSVLHGPVVAGLLRRDALFRAPRGNERRPATGAPPKLLRYLGSGRRLPASQHTIPFSATRAERRASPASRRGAALAPPRRPVPVPHPRQQRQAPPAKPRGPHLTPS